MLPADACQVAGLSEQRSARPDPLVDALTLQPLLRRAETDDLPPVLDECERRERVKQVQRCQHGDGDRQSIQGALDGAASQT